MVVISLANGGAPDKCDLLRSNFGKCSFISLTGGRGREREIDIEHRYAFKYSNGTLKTREITVASRFVDIVSISIEREHASTDQDVHEFCHFFQRSRHLSSHHFETSSS